mmetsp:Transcript_102750/g.329474  ORF Transcript_102750/g.329474 Transcript_102750/m.329474 type:complete len:317 (+) Transcript_102750:2938-3888(+)
MKVPRAERHQKPQQHADILLPSRMRLKPEQLLRVRRRDVDVGRRALVHVAEAVEQRAVVGTSGDEPDNECNDDQELLRVEKELETESHVRQFRVEGAPDESRHPLEKRWTEVMAAGPAQRRRLDRGHQAQAQSIADRGLVPLSVDEVFVILLADQGLLRTHDSVRALLPDDAGGELTDVPLHVEEPRQACTADTSRHSDGKQDDAEDGREHPEDHQHNPVVPEHAIRPCALLTAGADKAREALVADRLPSGRERALLAGRDAARCASVRVDMGIHGRIVWVGHRTISHRCNAVDQARVVREGNCKGASSVRTLGTR